MGLPRVQGVGIEFSGRFIHPHPVLQTQFQGGIPANREEESGEKIVPLWPGEAEESDTGIRGGGGNRGRYNISMIAGSDLMLVCHEIFDLKFFPILRKTSRILLSAAAKV